jgi:hypothetical protein
MAANHEIFVQWDNEKDIILIGWPRVAHLRDAFKAKYFASTAVPATDISVFDKKDGNLLDPFDDLTTLGRTKESALFIKVDMPVTPPLVAASLVTSPRSNSFISNHVSAVFEVEVNKRLDDHFQSILPGCEFSTFKNREIYEGEDCSVALEMDSFSYMTKDTLSKPENIPDLGIDVVKLPNNIFLEPKSSPEGQLGGSPGAFAVNLQANAQKYVVGESYSGQNRFTMKAKVTQLEQKLQKMKTHHEGCTRKIVHDVTTLFGAAIFSYTCHSRVRQHQKAICMDAVLEGLSENGTPALWRLAAAHRLFVAVLSTTDAAFTCYMRESASCIQNLDINLDLNASKMENLELKMDKLVKGIATINKILRGDQQPEENGPRGALAAASVPDPEPAPVPAPVPALVPALVPAPVPAPPIQAPVPAPVPMGEGDSPPRDQGRRGARGRGGRGRGRRGRGGRGRGGRGRGGRGT